ncbi:PREDICTED: uncharacterized protein LOC105951073 [Erythranthe guttata]|uniref:uncharacterized protein LOC105951073 n=1 Tax=Erythranthe guttata TaxID=4155 RepID=UPI00064D9540|nr:PREDICTED: uncharacterized protein LOC105951073 [Erythranthe guttata]|eukprot:XP_012829921.1 PREDICTED: uncharacterized protein LOC105951073 [Erythranthe guttata]
MKGKVKWGDTLELSGGFQFFKGYKEWTEDVLSRCQHKLKSAKIYDPVYASLFTYDYNSEVMKAFFEACCPCLSRTRRLRCKGCSVFSPFRRYLFHAYHLLRKRSKDPSSNVSVESWIQFWSKKQKKYTQPPPRKEKKSVRPKSTHNPSGNIEAHAKWINIEEAVFSSISVDVELRSETYLAAHLACWLCTFVLPTDDVGMIRPSTFKMASIMASGEEVSLAVPVLASIFNGINRISRSLRPHKENSLFPIHFVYCWLALYFKTHCQVLQGVAVDGPKMISYSGEGSARYYTPADARKRIHKGDLMSWTCTTIPRSESSLYVDDGTTKGSERNYFIAIRSSYLSLRRGNRFVIEPYSPHRFSRQFGYYQDVPGVLDEDVREASLIDGLRYWRLCVLLESMSKVMFSIVPQNPRKFHTDDYKIWWTKAYGTYLENKAASLMNLELSKIPLEDKEDEARGSLDNLSRENVLQTKNPPRDIKKKNVLPPSDESDNSHIERHWKRPKRDPQSSKPQDLHIDNNVDSHSRTNDTFAEKVALHTFPFFFFFF